MEERERGNDEIIIAKRKEKILKIFLQCKSVKISPLLSVWGLRIELSLSRLCGKCFHTLIHLVVLSWHVGNGFLYDIFKHVCHYGLFLFVAFLLHDCPHLFLLSSWCSPSPNSIFRWMKKKHILLWHWSSIDTSLNSTLPFFEILAILFWSP